jgi:hypothetical protein
VIEQAITLLWYGLAIFGVVAVLLVAWGVIAASKSK